MERLERFAMPGRREAWLDRAGFPVVDSELVTWHVDFAGEAEMWELASGPAMLGAVLRDADPEALAAVRRTLGELLADYRRADGSYRLPYGCRLLRGQR
jgi:hypothetical protein